MIGRMAGQALRYFTKDISKGEMAFRLGTDALGGGMAMMYTPGDIGDKLIAGAASTVGGAAGGLALGKLGGPGMLGNALDIAGSIGGDMGATVIGEQIMKGKSALQGEGFRTPWEKMSDQQQQMMAEQIKKDVLRQYGLAVPGAPISQYSDPTTGMGVN